MVNLIPTRAKKSVVMEYWLRVLTVWLVIGIIVAIIFAITMAPLYVLVNAKINVYEESATEASQKIASFQSVSESLSQSGQQAELLITNLRNTSLFSVLQLFGSLETGGIAINSINLSRATPNTLQPVNISGRATDRQALADFRDRLLAEDAVEVVDFPISNLAKDRDIDFSMEVTMVNELEL